VRLIGIVLLGSPRSDAANHAHESSPWMLGPMVILLCLSLTIAIIPQRVVGLMSGALDQVLDRSPGDTVLDLDAFTEALAILGGINFWLIAGCTLTACALLALIRRGPRAEGPTWGCGYVRPTPRMQYTGASFSQMMAGQLLPKFLRPRTSRKAPTGLFPSRGEFVSDCPDPVTAKVYEPLLLRAAYRITYFRILQQGKVHVYLFYVLLAVILALAWISARSWWATS
jgi:hydrogenase-4 component B